MARTFIHQKENKVGDWHCVVTQEPWNEIVKVYLAYRHEGKTRIVSIVNGEFVLTDWDQQKESEPMMKLPYFAWEAILGAMGGIEPDIHKEVVDSELKATKFHLEDMRKLVFKQ